MIENIAVPEVMKEALGSEKIEFFVKAKKDQPIKHCWSVIRSGIFWIFVVSLIFSCFVWELFNGGCTTISIDGVPTEVCPDNLSPLKGLFVMYCVFSSIGIILLVLGILGLFKSGGYYIGTESRLIQYSWNEVKSFPWEEFTDEIKVFGKNEDGNIVFKLKTGIYITRNHRKVLSNTMINIGSILYAYEIRDYCRDKILETKEQEALV
ncbi:hypothetical protein [Flavobacterium mesophilum]|uniref:hypothetical protein n=1 Tax=Flavobacterium mesophilum TaxID=3143495 RepID=UPI0031E44DFB